MDGRQAPTDDTDWCSGLEDLDIANHHSLAGLPLLDDYAGAAPPRDELDWTPSGVSTLPLAASWSPDCSFRLPSFLLLDDESDEANAAAPRAPLVDAGDGLAGQSVAEAPRAAPASEKVKCVTEPTVGRFVIDKTTAQQGLVIEVRATGRVILLEDDTTVTLAARLVDYADGEPPGPLIAVAEARGVPFVPLEATCSHCDEAFDSNLERHARVGDVTVCWNCKNRWRGGKPPIKSVRRPAMCLCCGGPFSNNKSYAGPYGPYTTCHACDCRRLHGKTGPAEPKEASYCRGCGCGNGDSPLSEGRDGVVRCGACGYQKRVGRPPTAARVQQYGGPTPQKAENLASAVAARNQQIAEYCASAGFALASEQPDDAAAAPAAADDDASDSGDDPSAGGAARPKWVQCDGCDKWRRLPPDVDVDRLPERAARVQNLELPHVIPHAINVTSSFNPCPLDV